MKHIIKMTIEDLLNRKNPEIYRIDYELDYDYVKDVELSVELYAKDRWWGLDPENLYWVKLYHGKVLHHARGIVERLNGEKIIQEPPLFGYLFIHDGILHITNGYVPDMDDIMLWQTKLETGLPWIEIFKLALL